MTFLNILPETRWTLPVRVRLPRWITVEDNGYGGLIVRGPGFYFQKSGHGAWCDYRVGRFEVWADPKTGRPFHFFWRRHNALSGSRQ